MGGHGDSQALPTVLCTPEAATPWVPVTSPIPGLTPLPDGAQALVFPLPTDVPTFETHPPHGETDPDGPMGGDDDHEPTDGAGVISALQSFVDSEESLLPLNWEFMSRKARKHWKQKRAKYRGQFEGGT